VAGRVEKEEWVTEEWRTLDPWEAAEVLEAELNGLKSDVLAAEFAAECEREAAGRLLSTAQVAERLGVTGATVRDRWRRGELRAYGSDAKLRFSWPDVLVCFEVRPVGRRDAVSYSSAASQLPRRPARRFKQINQETRRVA
jgi:hypothetical protein